MIKIEFPSNRTDIALAIGRALVEIGGESVATRTVETTVAAGGKAVATRTVETTVTAGGKAVATPELDPADPGGESAARPELDPVDPGGDVTPEDDRIDTKNVPFDEEFCGNAAKPFYESGAREGQWKKRKGVADTYYDEWYAEELAKLKPPADTTEEKPTIDVGAALAGQQATPQAEIPANGGELMQWVSEKQTARLLTPDDVQAAYTALGMDVPALFGPDGGKLAPAVHAILVQKAGQ